MSDYRDIKKNAHEEGILLDYCGSDERYYFNGVYVDLCGMSADDYMKSTQFDCECTGGTTPSDTATTKETITILFTYTKNEDGTFTSIVEANPAPKQDIEVSYIIQSNDDGEIPINGIITPSENPFIYTGMTFKSMYNIVGEEQHSIDVNDNEYYDEVILETGDEIAYYGFINSTALTEISSYDFSTLFNNTINDELTEVTLTLPEWNGEGNDPGNMDESEYAEFCKNNSYILALLFNEDDWDNNNVVITDPSENDITNTFVKIANNITINSGNFCVVAKMNDSGISYDTITLMSFINDNYEPLDVTFKLKIQ